MNVAEFILGAIQNLGTDTAFCLTGGMAMHINRAADESDLRMIYCNHEQAAAAAADGYARAKEFQVPGLAIVTSGPGVTNTITSVASAFYDSIPEFILAGQVKLTDINLYGVRSYGAQETPHLQLMEPITKAAFRYIPSEINDDILAEKLALAITGRKGPVFIEIPLDIQAQVIENGAERLTRINDMITKKVLDDKVASSTAISQIISGIAAASKPVLLIGNGLRIAGITRGEIKKLVEKLGIPTLFTWASFDFLSHDHELNFGCAGGLAPTHANKILQAADFVLFLGARLDLLTTAFNPNNYGKSAKRLVVELDAREIQKNLAMQNTTFINENVAGIFDGLLRADIKPQSAQDWLSNAKRLKLSDEKNEQLAFGDKGLTTYKIAQVLSSNPSADYIVPTASGYAIEGIARFFKPNGRSTFAWGGHVLGSMGLGLPSAIGAVAALNRPVICLEGDGGLLLNIQEIFTLAANPDLPLSIIVLNNGGYQSIIKSQNRAFNKEFGASSSSGLYAVPFNLIGELAGLTYLKCSTLAEFQAVMKKGLHRCLLELLVEEDGYRGPAVQTKFDKNGKPYSTDIEDISWQ